MTRKFLTRRIITGLLITSSLCTNTSQAETNWLPVIEANNSQKSKGISEQKLIWEEIPQGKKLSVDLMWKPLTTEQSGSQLENLYWDELGDDQQEGTDQLINGKHDLENHVQPELTRGLRWPNGQLMSNEDQIYFRTAYSRGSMVQIGDTIYPNIGMNALQRHPRSWVNIGIAAIDDSWGWFGPGNKPEDCEQGNFVSTCADGVMQNRIRLWASEDFSADLSWTIHSLSGEGSPINFTFGENEFGDQDGGTKFGEGQSLGFRISKNLGKTFGVSIGGDRLWHLDETTDLSKPLYIRATKIFRLNDSLEPPIVSITLGVMSDVYNPDTIIGKVKYPDWLLGGEYPSIFAEKYDGKNKRSTNGRGYYPNVAGVSSAFVCAEETIFRLPRREPTDEHKNCIKQVFVAPIGSIGFAPWPWLGFYGNFTRNLNLGVSVKPFKDIHWTISAEMVSPIIGLNSRMDKSIKRNRCPNDQSFSPCRTRIGFWTDLSF